MPDEIHHPGRRQLYGRRRGHKLRPGQQALIDALRSGDLSAFRAPDVPRGGGAASAGAVDPAVLFPDASETWLEIGFGGGEHLAAEAARRPDVGFIGCEHYVDGVAKLAATLARAGLGNVLVHPHDARDLMDALPDASLGRIYLLYPDPWPKKRHHKRRFVNPANLDAIARVLRPGGELRIASDIPDYIRHCLAHVAAHDAFEWMAERPADWRAPWAGWPGTRYEEKALREGRTPAYLRVARR